MKTKELFCSLNHILERKYEKRRHSIVITYFIDADLNKRHSLLFKEKKCSMNKEAVLYL